MSDDLVVEELSEYTILDEEIKERQNRQDQIKAAVLAAVGVKIGTITIQKEGFKVSTVGKETLTLDENAWNQIKEEIPESMHPIKTKITIEPDVKMITAMRLANPDLWGKLSPAFVRKQSKPTVKIKKA